MNLIRLETEYRILWEMLEASQGELTPEIESYMAEIQANTVSAAFSLQDMRDEAEMYVKQCKERAAELVDRAKRFEKTSENLKQVIIKVLQMSGEKTIQNAHHRITLTKNPVKVEIIDESLVPDSYKVVECKIPKADFLKVKDTIPYKSAKESIEKSEISALYKSAEVEVVGCAYVRSDNVKVS